MKDILQGKISPSMFRDTLCSVTYNTNPGLTGNNDMVRNNDMFCFFSPGESKYSSEPLS